MATTVHDVDRYQTPITDAEMRAGESRRGLITMWGTRFDDNSWVLARRDVDPGDEDDGYQARYKVAVARWDDMVGTVNGGYDEFYDPIDLSLATITDDGWVPTEQMWPYVPPEVDVPKMLAVLCSLAAEPTDPFTAHLDECEVCDVALDFCEVGDVQTITGIGTVCEEGQAIADDEGITVAEPRYFSGSDGR